MPLNLAFCASGGALCVVSPDVGDMGDYRRKPMATRLGNMLREHRRSLRPKVSQADAADRFGVGQGTYARWETGKYKPEPWRLPAIAEWLGISIDDVQKAYHEVDEPTTLVAIEAQVAELTDRLERMPSIEAELETAKAQIVQLSELIETLTGQPVPPLATPRTGRQRTAAMKAAGAKTKSSAPKKAQPAAAPAARQAQSG